MNLKELLQLKEVQNHFGIVIKEEDTFRATLKFAEDITVVGVDINKNQITVIPYHDGTLHNHDIREILFMYNIVGCIDKYHFEEIYERNLECTWLETYIPYEEMSNLALEDYAESCSIFVLEMKSNIKLKLDGGVADGEVSEM